VVLRFTPEGVELAYRYGIFPMGETGSDDIYWFQPDPRTIIPLEKLHVSRSLAKTLRKGHFEVRYDTDFEGVMRGCADRPEGTWITEPFIALYGELHRRGLAHSVEVVRDGRLVGGTYGVALGGAFMAESMFHYETDASKVALKGLVDRLRSRGFVLLDVQYLTPHLASLGAVEIPHRTYLRWLQVALRMDCVFD
jgi:leucyl/phenylalanyl-tRNA--protein transferase